MRKYGAHYKVNGPPVNVPTTFNQVIDMLPRMPQQLQIHPLKLKWKLEYKSHYMYDVIQKDHVMAALSWLKEHNHNYGHVQFNNDWYNTIPDNGLSQLIQEDHSDSDSDHNINTHPLHVAHHNNVELIQMFADATPSTLMICILLMRAFHALYITKIPTE